MIFQGLALSDAVEEVAALLAVPQVRDDATFFLLRQPITPKSVQGFLISVLISAQNLPADAPEQKAEQQQKRSDNSIHTTTLVLIPDKDIVQFVASPSIHTTTLVLIRAISKQATSFSKSPESLYTFGDTRIALPRRETKTCCWAKASVSL